MSFNSRYTDKSYLCYKQWKLEGHLFHIVNNAERPFVSIGI